MKIYNCLKTSHNRKIKVQSGYVGKKNQTSAKIDFLAIERQTQRHGIYVFITADPGAFNCTVLNLHTFEAHI